MDEDRFAKNLLPELFKHDKYASFVRQLNMYGFHKKVGLSDNSMRASESRNKIPSEYSNPYFKKSRPNLLYLIQKPKTTSRRPRGARGEFDTNAEDDGPEVQDVDGAAQPDRQDSLRGSRQPLLIGQSEVSLSQESLVAVRRELNALREQQGIITTMIKKI